MAFIWPDMGLDYMLGLLPKDTENSPATIYIGLFTSQTATTVPARTATGGGSPAGWTEATGTAYARQSIAAGSWGAISTNGNGRKVTAGQVTFPTVGSGGWGTVNGFFLATHVSSQAGDTIFYFANFDDLTAKTLSEFDVEKVTPSIQFNGV